MRLSALLLLAIGLQAQSPGIFRPGGTQNVVTANRIQGGNGAPGPGCSVVADAGKTYVRQDGAAAHSSLYVCSNTGIATFAWELEGGGISFTTANDTNVSLTLSGTVLTAGWLGTLAAARMVNAGVHTGDSTSTFPAVTISAGAITLAKLANLNANSIICNNTGSGATPIACTQAQIATMLAGQALFALTTTGTSGAATYTGGTLNIPQYTGISGLTITKIPKAASSTTLGDSSLTDNGTTLATTEPFSAPSASFGTSPPASSVCTIGTSGMICLGEGTTPTGTLSGVGVLWPNASTHRWGMINNATVDVVMGAATTDTLTNKTFDTAGTGNSFKINGTAVTAVSGTGAVCLASASACTLENLPAPGATCTFAANSTICIATTTATITVPPPVAGYQFCVMNDDNVSTVITLSAIGSSARYENTARTAYGTAGTGTFISGGAVGDFVCIVGRDSTHYLTVSSKGTWTAS